MWYLETIENGFEGCSHRSCDKATPDLEAKTCAPKEGIPDVEKSDGVYCIQCADCPATYVGETKRKLSKRLDDHNRVVKVADFNASAIAEHAWSAGHSVNWDGVTVLDQHKNLYPRLILELYHIRKQSFPLNRDKRSHPST